MTELMQHSAPSIMRANAPLLKAAPSIWFTFWNGPHIASCHHRNLKIAIKGVQKN
eukprot:NODE_12642_length_379_cov_2.333333_g11493_i0.p3 GENE.NODE_12642_length_379_cov_2.333333_g11493_i0~~NODE_12642_length_379_cov_2.333333_g11493_i0.p3  ORF type:complete len:55 (-),score=3.07 NODE_12642_length_379_cov_2.333333_g11493_i0:102-266(-)